MFMEFFVDVVFETYFLPRYAQQNFVHLKSNISIPTGLEKITQGTLRLGSAHESE
jgi:hypothetical protein